MHPMLQAEAKMDNRTKRYREEDEAMSEREQDTSPMTDVVHTLSPNAHTFVMCALAQHKIFWSRKLHRIMHTRTLSQKRIPPAFV